MRHKHLLGRLLDMLLLPVALLVVLLEDVVWAGLRALLRRVTAWPPLAALQAWLGTLSGYAALPLFLVPEIFGRVGEIWAVALLVGGHVKSAVLVYGLVRLVATLLAVFIYHACEPALLRIHWFAVAVGWVRWVRDWAMALLAPLRARIHALWPFAPGLLGQRWAAIRRRIAIRRS
ncbi:MAG TPA: hypothetical protein VGC80_17845 [Acetobacteraceae bacterium]